jgi:transposase
MDLSLPGLGIDVSLATLDVKLSSEKHKRRQFNRVPNTLEGLEQIVQWLELQGIARVHVCLEATGTYSDLAALFFFERGHQVSVVNPARVKAFRRSEGMVSKTDRQDALLLARFVEQKRPALWRPTPDVLQQAKVLLARIDDVSQMYRQEKNRLGNQRLDAQTRQEIQEHLDWLESKRAQCERRVVELLKESQSQARSVAEACDGKEEEQQKKDGNVAVAGLTAEQMGKGCHLIDSIPGIGQLTAVRLYSVYWDQERFKSAGSVVNYAGISSAQRESKPLLHELAIQMCGAGCICVRLWPRHMIAISGSGSRSSKHEEKKDWSSLSLSCAKCCISYTECSNLGPLTMHTKPGPRTIVRKEGNLK